MKFPDFIIAGCMKCGSTSLFMNLSKHPEITMSGIFGPLGPNQTKGTGTEINYWDNWKKKRDIDWYKSRFSGDLSGEKSPGYWNHKGAIRNSFRHNPDAKYIISLRNPVDRAHSHYMMNRLRTTSKAPFTTESVKPLHIGLGRYYSKLKNGILRIIPRENVHISISDWMKTDTSNEMMKIHKFLGIEEIDLPTKEIQWKKMFVSLYEVGQDKSSYIKWSGHSKKQIDPNVRKQFLKIYKKSNEKLFDFLGYKIPEWGS